MASIIKSKSLLDIAKQYNCKTNADLFKIIKGKRLRTSGVNRSGHAYPPKFICNGMHPTHMNQPVRDNQSILFMVDKSVNWYHTNCYLSEMSLDSITTKEMQAGLEELANQQVILKKELDLCTELGIDEYDEKLIKTIIAIEQLKKSKIKDKLKEAKGFLESLESL